MLSIDSQFHSQWNKSKQQIQESREMRIPK
jgi:hypothetical protein